MLKKTLEAQGFVVAVTTSEDSSKENGIVLKQSLDSGKTVEKRKYCYYNSK